MSGDSAGWTPGKDIAPLLQAALAAGAKGTSNRLTEGFAKIEAEIAKLDSATKAEVDWTTVQDESKDYLEKVAPDLRVATYLAMAWAELRGGNGLRRGIDLVTGILGEPWETLYPPLERLKARAGALSWFSEHVGPRLSDILAVRKLEKDEPKELVASFVRYQGVVAQRFPKGGPSLGPLEKAFAAAQTEKKLPEPEKKKEEAAAPVSDDPILQPIGDNKVGKDPKLTDEFDQLYPEIQKIGAVDGGDVDWKLVRDNSATILTKHGKDIRCVMYWAWARFCIDGVKGLVEGLASVAGFAQAFGDEMFPKRAKARGAALKWLGVRLEEDLPKALKSVPEADMNAMKASLDDAQKHYEPLVKTLEGIYQGRKGLTSIKVDRPKPKPQPKAAKPAAKAGVQAAPSGPPAPVVPEELESVSAQMLDAAGELAAGGENTASLRLRRQALWLAAPPLIKGKKYDCESLAGKDRLELEGVFKGKRWDELLERTESMFPAYPFCLDLTFWAAKAAGELIGDEARKALAGELVALAVRHPKLGRGTDRSGQALASKEARAFIALFKGSGGTEGASTTSSAPAGAAGAAPAPAAAAVVVVPDVLPPEIEQLFKDGKVSEAVGRASATAAGLTGRAAYARNLLLAERLVDAKSHGLAFSLFRALLGQLRTMSLPQWEPRMGARCIRGYLRCARATKAKLEDDRELLDELVLLDPGAAVGLV